MAGSNFQLNKWFLDFVGDNGEIMIFYAARLIWNGIPVNYGSWLHYDPENGINERTHFRNVKFPEQNKNMITWRDEKFDVSGSWENVAEPLKARIFDADDGYLDWNCLQPASKVQLKINNKILEGKGYVEQLILTAPPWQIPMNELRWGRFHSSNNTMVWIELRKDNKQQWLWLNGERITNCNIEDDHISSSDKDFLLKLDRSVVLESENKIYRVIHKLLRYIPGFNKLMPNNFLMAYNQKWLSKAEFQKSGSRATPGIAIHEWVNFNAQDL